MERIRSIIKEQFGSNVNSITQNDTTFSKMAHKPSNLGCLEFKYHDENADIDGKVKEFTPLLNDLGVKFISILKMSNTLVITVNRTNAEEVKNICKKFGMTLTKETFSDGGTIHNPYIANANIPDMEKTTDFGRGSSIGRTSLTAGSMMTGYPVDRLAGE